MAVSSPIGTGILEGWEIVLILTMILLLYSAKNLPDSRDGLRQRLETLRRFLRREEDDTGRDSRTEDPRANRPDQAPRSRSEKLALWLARGFDIGRSLHTAIFLEASKGAR